MRPTYFFIRRQEPLDIGEFIPAVSVKPSESQYFGGWVVDVPDLRPYEELSRCDFIHGIEVLEGGCGRLYVKGCDLFQTREDALKTLC